MQRVIRIWTLMPMQRVIRVCTLMPMQRVIRVHILMPMWRVIRVFTLMPTQRLLGDLGTHLDAHAEIRVRTLMPTRRPLMSDVVDIAVTHQMMMICVAVLIAMPPFSRCNPLFNCITPAIDKGTHQGQGRNAMRRVGGQRVGALGVRGGGVVMLPVSLFRPGRESVASCLKRTYADSA